MPWQRLLWMERSSAKVGGAEWRNSERESKVVVSYDSFAWAPAPATARSLA